MLINKNSWHYKAWKLSFVMWGNSVPRWTSLCPYVRNILLLPLAAILWVMVMSVIGIVYLYLLTLQTIGGFFIGRLPDGWDLRTRAYAGLKINHMEIYPWHILLLLLPVGIVPAFTSMSVLTVASIMFGLVALVFGAVKIWHSNSFLIFRAWVQAKKDGVCPVIDFEDK